MAGGAQPQFVRCPNCQYGTLADGHFCAYCGRPLRGPPPQAYAPPAGYAPPAQGGYAAPPSGGGRGSRAPLTCGHCGMANDPWLTHCKSCQRPLGTTG